MTKQESHDFRRGNVKTFRTHTMRSVVPKFVGVGLVPTQ